MLYREYLDFNGAYDYTVRAVLEHGVECSPRGLKCIEARPATLLLLSPKKSLYQGKSRKLNYRFFAVETLQYLAGCGTLPGHATLLCAANSKMAEFVNQDTGKFDGAYGPRLSKSLGTVVQMLKQDPDSRQAVASIWSPGIPQNSKDVPCTLSLHFYRELIKHPVDNTPILAMSATMRSNDLNWGTPYDVAAFSTLQCVVAGLLGWRVGSYHHAAHSLHVYTEHRPKLVRVGHEEWIDVRLPDLGELMPNAQGLGFINLQYMCWEYLTDLYKHVISEGWSFPTFESRHDHAHPWFAAWTKLVRWSWS